jgi:glutamine phosphoribosylpyrophosphate amidotransferase
VLISEIAQRTGLSRAEAANIVGDAETQVQQARQQIGTQLDTLQARAPDIAQDVSDAASRAAWWALLVLGLSFGAAAFGASFTARE